MGLLQFGDLLLKNDSLFLKTSYSHQQAAILRGTCSSILSGEGFDEVVRGESPLVLSYQFPNTFSKDISFAGCEQPHSSECQDGCRPADVCVVGCELMDRAFSPRPQWGTLTQGVALG
jgi:hypothetical protein